MTLSENGLETPVFDVKHFSSRVKARDGDFIAEGGMMPDREPKDFKCQTWKGGALESIGKNFVALHQVKANSVK